MEHGIDKIRTALEGNGTESSLLQKAQKTAGDECLSRSAGDSGDHESADLHLASSSLQFPAALLRKFPAVMM